EGVPPGQYGGVRRAAEEIGGLSRVLQEIEKLLIAAVVVDEFIPRIPQSAPALAAVLMLDVLKGPVFAALRRQQRLSRQIVSGRVRESRRVQESGQQIVEIHQPFVHCA